MVLSVRNETNVLVAVLQTTHSCFLKKKEVNYQLNTIYLNYQDIKIPFWHTSLASNLALDFLILYCRSLYQLLLLVLFYHRETNFNVLLSSFHDFLDYIKHQASFNLALIIPSEYLNPFAASLNDPG